MRKIQLLMRSNLAEDRQRKGVVKNHTEVCKYITRCNSAG